MNCQFDYADFNFNDLKGLAFGRKNFKNPY